MDNQNSILDKVMASKQIQEASQFIPADFVLKLLRNLNIKEREILTKRFGLEDNEKQTLEEIGKIYQITRERIRQIQMTAIKKIKELEELKNDLGNIESLVNRLLEEYGGVMEENHLVDRLLSFSENNLNNRQATLFILDHLLQEKIERINDNEHFLPGWKINILPREKIINILNTLHQIIEEKNELLTLDQLIEEFKAHNFYQENSELFKPNLISSGESNNDTGNLKKILESYLKISRKIDQNIMNEWGLNRWATIKPKRMSDKVYMILRKENKPLHFREIADFINKANFDKKVAHPATIHNELILNDKFVLIGRGIYALSEWGYKPGTVADVISEILKNSGRPLTKEEITNEVLKSRMVKKSTINLALTDKNRFKKLPDQTYTLV